MKRNSIVHLLILTLTITVGCENVKNGEIKIIEGDLYFNWFRYANFYNQPDSVINKMIVFADTVNPNLLDSSEKEFLAMYEVLKKEKLLYSPYIELRLKDNSIMKLFLTPNEYHKVTSINHQSLIDRKKKIRVKAEAREITPSLAQCRKLISLEEIDGETLRNSKKIKIDNYH